MTHEILKDEVEFVNGSPTVEYNRIFACFKDYGNGLFFRLVNDETHQWAFYNDTADTIMKVRAVFGPGSNVKPLRRAKVDQITVPKDDGTPGDVCDQVTVEVEPFRTEPFIEGTTNGFSLDFQSEAAPLKDVQFEYRRPSVAYDKIYKCFKNNGNGLLFRLVDEKKQTWHFYNDTKDYIMTATVEFANREGITPLGKTEDAGTSDDNPDGAIFVLQIEPGKTEPFVEGEAVNYRLSFAAEPTSNDHPVDPSELNYENGEPDESIVAKDSKVYRCFKNNGNGLLFRIVDENKQLWAFYNDTVDYLMKATVRFPESENLEPCDDAVAMEDANEPGWTVVTLEIPPLATVPFIHGLPNNFEVSFSAESVNKAAPEENPAYENGEPNREVIDYKDVYRCFRDRGNGLLFRLVTADRKQWGFYNDTTDITITARVTFEKNSTVEAVGQTTTEEEDGETVYVLAIPPCTTLAFVSGELGGFSSKFTAVRRASASQ